MFYTHIACVYIGVFSDVFVHRTAEHDIIYDDIGYVSQNCFQNTA